MARTIIPYEPHLKQLARNLRNNSTRAEIYLWMRLMGKRMKRFDFHRQKPLLKYIVDFYCHELNLAIEIDGDIHEQQDVVVYDKLRQKEIENYGVTFLRFSNSDVINNIDWVLETIENWIVEFEKGSNTHP